LFKFASGTQTVLTTANVIIQAANLNFHDYGGQTYSVTSIEFYTSGPSLYIPFTTQTAGATTPNPGSIGNYTISGTNMYVWNGSLWVLFAGSSSV